MRGAARLGLSVLLVAVAPAFGEEAEGTTPVDAAAVEARVGAAFAVVASPPPLDLGGTPATAQTTPTPPGGEAAGLRATSEEAFAPPAGVGGFAPSEAALGFAAPGGVETPTDRAFAGMPRPIAVPTPRRRPSQPTVAARVAAIDAAEAVGAPERLVETPPILAEDGILGPPKKVPKEALPYLRLIEREAAKNKVPLWLALGVGFVESKYDPRLRGAHSVMGLMQVMPSTARFQGYRGTNDGLLDPETNIVWGMKELGWDFAAAKGDPCLAIAKYKGGISTKRISPAAADYCRRAKAVTGMI